MPSGRVLVEVSRPNLRVPVLSEVFPAGLEKPADGALRLVAIEGGSVLTPVAEAAVAFIAKKSGSRRKGK